MSDGEFRHDRSNPCQFDGPKLPDAARLGQRGRRVDLRLKRWLAWPQAEAPNPRYQGSAIREEASNDRSPQQGLPRMTAPARMTTAEAAVATLANNGIDTLYCLPGVQNDHLFDAFHKAQDRIRPIHTRHEQGAAYMALGAAMATGKPQVYSVVPGPGFLNTTAALSTAYACNAPVMALLGQIPSALIGRGTGQLHEIPDQLAIMRQLTKFSARITGPQDAAPLVTEAFRQMRAGRPRPVALEGAIDVWGRTGAAEMLPPAPATPGPVDLDAIGRAAKLLGAARTPLIIVGAGAQDASPEVTALAEALQAPVVSHRMGRGVLDSRNPLSVNVHAGHTLWGKADVVLAVGTRLQMQLQGWGADKGLTIIRIDADAEEIDRIAAPALGITADAATALRALLDALPAHNQARASRAEEMRELHAASNAALARLEPQIGYLQAIRDVMPSNGILVDELTQLGYVSRLTFPIHRPRGFLSPGYQGTLGWGLATALGAQSASPGVPVVAVSGDGGFMFNVQELATAVQFELPIVVVLVNDNAYGNVRRTQVNTYGNRLIASDLCNPNFAGLVESFGAQALRATSPDELRPALEKALGSGRPTVIEIPAGQMPDPWPMLRMPRNRG
jgi:acetolactate synthase-1/2/3 large subunit